MGEVYSNLRSDTSFVGVLTAVLVSTAIAPACRQRQGQTKNWVIKSFLNSFFKK
jgi:hypothetical protein